MLLALEDRLRGELAGVATVERSEFEAGGFCWDVDPLNPRSLSVNWIEHGDGIILALGSRAERWELDRTAEDVEFIEAVARSAIAGQVVETFAMARGRVDATLPDGREVNQTTYQGCLFGLIPLPGWRRWGTVVQYEPYA